MLHINQLMAASLLVSSAVVAQAGNLWIIGSAVPEGWSQDGATALLSQPGTQLYTGTIFLKATYTDNGEEKDASFKFFKELNGYNGEQQVGASSDTNPYVVTPGTEIPLAGGTSDNEFAQLKVPEDGNYYISVDLETMKAEIVKSAYQDTEINYCSLFMIGSIYDPQYGFDESIPLYQQKDTPYEYSATSELKAGSFKIATNLKGARGWDQKYFYFMDPNDPDKMVLNQDGDHQWSIQNAGDYTVTANTKDNTISIKSTVSSVVSSIATDNAPAVYYTLDGVKVNNPAKGLYIVKQGSKVSKVILK